jgi:oxygen-dependent protoporphyrinogen oxidase
MAGIVVVGAGVAGLACAWRLQRAGHDVQVLDQAPEIGGRVRVEQREDHRIQVGAGFVTDGQRNVRSIAAPLGLSTVVSLEPGGTVPGRVLRSGRFEDCALLPGLRALRSSLLPPISRIRLGRLATELLLRRDRLDPLQPERAARLEDGEEMPHFVARLVGDEARDRLLAPVMSALFGCKAEEMSAAFFLLCLQSLSQGSEPITFEGGLARLPQELARSLSIRTGCEVFSVETERGGTRVRYRGGGRQRSFLAEAVVVAVPGPVVPSVCTTLTSDERSFFESVRYAPGVQVDLLLDEPVARDLAFGTCFARGDGIGLRSIFEAHREPGSAPDGAARLTVQLGDSAARRLARSKDEEISGWTLDALARTPLGLLSPRASVVHRWQYARPIFPRGTLSRLENFAVRKERSPRIAFAGDYLLAPTVEGALTSGMRAASRVIQSLDDVGAATASSRLQHAPD